MRCLSWKKIFRVSGNCWTRHLAYRYEIFRSCDDYVLPITTLVKEDFFSELKTGYPKNIDIQRTNHTIESFNIETGRELTELCLKIDVILQADVFEKFIKVSLKERRINLHYGTYATKMEFIIQCIVYFP